MSRMILLLIATLLLAMPFSDVIAQKKAAPKAKSGVSEVLGTLDWGVTLTEVLDAAKLRLTREWKGKLKTLDTLGIDRLRRQKANEFDALKKSLRRLDGRRTGYESSVIGDEILARKNEAVLKQIIAGQTRFYFFRDARLWKIAVVFDASRS